MDERLKEINEEELELNRRPVTQISTALPVAKSRVLCSTEQPGEIPEPKSVDSHAPIEGHLQNLNDQLPTSAQCTSMQHTTE